MRGIIGKKRFELIFLSFLRMGKIGEFCWFCWDCFCRGSFFCNILRFSFLVGVRIFISGICKDDIFKEGKMYFLVGFFILNIFSIF